MSISARSSPVWFPEDRNCYSDYVRSPSMSQSQNGEPQAGTEPADQETHCPIRNIASQINSCAKARVIALLAMEFLVLDGKLHGDRSNWACPLGECKENFPNAKILMQHVAGCAHFSGDRVYCNSCRKHDCFTFHCRDRDGQLSGACDIGMCDKDFSPKKNKGLRKLTSLFSRSRSGSKSSSSGGCHHIDSPNAAGGRRVSSVSSPETAPTTEDAGAQRCELPEQQATMELGPSFDPSASGTPLDDAAQGVAELPTPEPCRTAQSGQVSAPNASSAYTWSPADPFATDIFPSDSRCSMSTSAGTASAPQANTAWSTTPSPQRYKQGPLPLTEMSQTTQPILSDYALLSTHSLGHMDTSRTEPASESFTLPYSTPSYGMPSSLHQGDRNATSLSRQPCFQLRDDARVTTSALDTPR
ncbi:hypothetical protein QQS21_007271 [Conoideocrella luteorostrata]|uniref:C2H2-type domain-containing protein n=1 Tax=Conoideocrella luteorostrata TaxID=1105319 RepID=A0AAJ0FSL5_9HYPO|nr:hypothetical protein QQS21_007271 [Conoideocrella luteorostrata]